MRTTSDGSSEVLARLAKLRMHQQNGVRSPHKPLLVLLALGRLQATGSSELPWTETWPQLGALIEEFGPTRAGGKAQRAAYPFTRLRSDNVWVLDHNVTKDHVKALGRHRVVGRFEDFVEAKLRADPSLVNTAARTLVESHFPATVAPDVLTAVGLDPEVVLRYGDVLPDEAAASEAKRRDPRWRSLVLQAWDRQCAFCGYDGQLGSRSAGVEAAHVRWFAFGGPDALDNGLALCSLHHKLFDLGVLGLDTALRVRVSETFTARTDEGRRVYDLHDRELRPRPGTPTPDSKHVGWHTEQVFRGKPLTAAAAG
jgi:putative restriction endonuclease